MFFKLRCSTRKINRVWKQLLLRPFERKFFLRITTRQNQINSALIIRNKWPSATTFQSQKDKGNKENYWCDFCRRKGHTRDRCWKLHGKPSTIYEGNLVMNSEVNSQSDAPKNKSNTITLVLEKLCT